MNIDDKNAQAGRNSSDRPSHIWIRLKASQQQTIEEAEQKFGISLNLGIDHAVEENGFALLPIALPLRENEDFYEVKLLMALGQDLLITVEPDAPVEPLERAAALLASLAEVQNSHTVLKTIMESMVDSTHDTVHRISMALNDLSDESIESSGGFDLKGHQVGVADISDTAVRLGQAEELIAKTVEGQLMIERALRWLRRGSVLDDIEMTALLSDVQGGRRHAQFQHAKVRNVLQSLMTTLDLKQNQIIKVFTIVTAVFTPPTLIAAFYGQNFAYMPELSLPWGEWAVMGSTAFFALMPLMYIKRKGWLR